MCEPIVYKCVILNISQPYRTPRPVAGIVLLLPYQIKETKACSCAERGVPEHVLREHRSVLIFQEAKKLFQTHGSVILGLIGGCGTSLHNHEEVENVFDYEEAR
jgi:hypothetical protein